MAKTRVRDVVVDPRFFVPSNVVDVRNDSVDNGDYYYGDSDVAQEVTITAPTEDVPLPPSTFQIIEQVVRINADGSSAVDVTFDFPNINGVYAVEPRVTPI